MSADYDRTSIFRRVIVLAKVGTRSDRLLQCGPSRRSRMGISPWDAQIDGYGSSQQKLIVSVEKSWKMCATSSAEIASADVSPLGIRGAGRCKAEACTGD